MHRSNHISIAKWACIAMTLCIQSACKDKQVVATPNQAYDVVLVIGQSNTMAGLGFDVERDTTHVKVWQLGRWEKDDHKIIVANDPLQHHDKRLNQIGFAMTFARLYANEMLQNNRHVLLIPSGKGSTGFISNHWNKGDALYKDALERTQFVLTKNHNNKLVAILWHQGEHDEFNTNYQYQLDSFIIQFRRDLESEQTPFVLGGLVPYFVKTTPTVQHIDSIIMKTPNRLLKVGYASPNIPFVLEKPNNDFELKHFDANGQRELGKRYFEIWKAMK